MKKLFTYIVILFASFFIVNCGNNEITENYPLDLDIIDFSLTGTNCNWNWQAFQKDSFVVLNSKEEFVARIICQDDNVPAIDFENSTLLFTWGPTTTGVHSIDKHIKQTSKTNYILSIDVKLNMAAVPQGWYIAILTPKLSSKSNIELDINLHY